jgi:hypothetical protein
VAGIAEATEVNKSKSPASLLWGQQAGHGVRL